MSLPQHDRASDEAPNLTESDVDLLEQNGSQERRLANVSISNSGWQIGQTIFLQNDSGRQSVKLIGYVEGKSILVTAPQKNGKVLLVREGQVFVVRTFAGKSAYAFTSSVLRSAHGPFPHLHLSYPTHVNCAAVRRNERIETNVIAAVSASGSRLTTAMAIRDISMGGAAGSIRGAIGSPGEQFRLKCRLNVADEEIYLDLPATLRSVQQEATESYRHGFEFGRLDVRDKLALGAFLHEIRFGQM